VWDEETHFNWTNMARPVAAPTSKALYEGNCLQRRIHFRNLKKRCNNFSRKIKGCTTHKIKNEDIEAIFLQRRITQCKMAALLVIWTGCGKKEGAIVKSWL
jgi:hypothetical protein